MQTLIQTSNLGLDKENSQILNAFVNEKLSKLANFSNSITTVNVWLTASNHATKKYDVKIKASIPSKIIFIKKEDTGSIRGIFLIALTAVIKEITASKFPARKKVRKLVYQ